MIPINSNSTSNSTATRAGEKSPHEHEPSRPPLPKRHKTTPPTHNTPTPAKDLTIWQRWHSNHTPSGPFDNGNGRPTLLPTHNSCLHAPQYNPPHYSSTNPTDHTHSTTEHNSHICATTTIPHYNNSCSSSSSSSSSNSSSNRATDLSVCDNSPPCNSCLRCTQRITPTQHLFPSLSPNIDTEYIHTNNSSNSNPRYATNYSEVPPPSLP